MSNYYNHVLLWLKANKPDCVLVKFHYKTDPPGKHYWYLESVDYVCDVLWIGDNNFEEYITKFSKEATLRFFKFTEPGEMEDI